MRSFTLLAAALATAASAGDYRFDPSTGSCRNAAGELGLGSGAPGPCVDLSLQDLAGASLDGADLRGARLDGANLSRASLLRADLTSASLRGTRLDRAVLTGARLDGAHLEAASLARAHLEHASLTHASLRDADLRLACVYRARFGHADLRGARFSLSPGLLEGAVWAGAHVDERTTLPWSAAQRAARDFAVEGPLVSFQR